MSNAIVNALAKEVAKAERQAGLCEEAAELVKIFPDEVRYVNSLNRRTAALARTKKNIEVLEKHIDKMKK